MELGHLPYRRATYEDYVGRRGLERLGKKRWRRHVDEVIELLRAALLPDEIVLGGGNAEKVRRSAACLPARRQRQRVRRRLPAVGGEATGQRARRRPTRARRDQGGRAKKARK